MLTSLLLLAFLLLQATVLLLVFLLLLVSLSCWHMAGILRHVQVQLSPCSVDCAATKRWILERLHQKAVHHITVHS